MSAVIIGLWALLHLNAVFFWSLSEIGWLGAVTLVLVQTWLSVGLFIVAHDSMHGSLAPGWRRVNVWLGALCAFLYCGFSYEALRRAHFAHHTAPGTVDDPDFHATEPEALLSWYWSFLTRYFGGRQAAFLGLVMFAELVVLGAPVTNVLLFWAAPAILSSFQLFLFGTWLPHRHRPDDFTDRHRARTIGLPWLPSLLTCFHFGYHYEHHLHPGVPWWALPRLRRAYAKARPAIVSAGSAKPS